jgi:hypothetical protein
MASNSAGVFVKNGTAEYFENESIVSPCVYFIVLLVSETLISTVNN